MAVAKPRCVQSLLSPHEIDLHVAKGKAEKYIIGNEPDLHVAKAKLSYI